MRIWFTIFVLLFALTEFFQWAKHFTVPLPVFILGGVLLAIASNSNKRAGFPFGAAKPLKASPNPSQASIPLSQAPATPLPQNQTAQLQATERSISFVIPKPEQLG